MLLGVRFIFDQFNDIHVDGFLNKTTNTEIYEVVPLWVSAPNRRLKFPLPQNRSLST